MGGHCPKCPIDEPPLGITELVGRNIINAVDRTVYKHSITQQGCLDCYVNQISTLLYIDKGADISIMSKLLYDQETDKSDRLDVFSAIRIVM